MNQIHHFGFIASGLPRWIELGRYGTCWLFTIIFCGLSSATNSLAQTASRNDGAGETQPRYQASWNHVIADRSSVDCSTMEGFRHPQETSTFQQPPQNRTTRSLGHSSTPSPFRPIQINLVRMSQTAHTCVVVCVCGY